mmetsp:Transcript_37742/g.94890  ORF Transcript_37742/g.94890 Transcript_37742/m.94890 type:complete len:700 (-) Transcript_37742:122-2221(-)|eukprot:CAMPEP_0177654990 /NCGR_PEP_ID=MMETSP0447-20121125/14681_1 /TAXON_ID=0 /ORGANISM="Stygamoeba regulata, Strain BSH-02190019" /LENGTH=699 /DNA_ID=CAMNT_0019158785 /DNA_START=167 /DNA_END=2266 /DNA_ORIENTATION=-
MRVRFSALVAFALIASCLLALSSAQDTRLKAGFVYNADLTHLWTYEHELGRHGVASAHPTALLTSVKPSVAEFNLEVSREAFEELIAEGNTMIFSTSSGFEVTAKALAQEYPEISFVQNPSSSSEADNYVAVDARLYEPYYLCGYLAGFMSQTHRIGVISGVQIPLVVTALNAIDIGARDAVPESDTYAVYLFDWVDPRLHQQATHQLLARGCDMILTLTGSTVPDEIVASLSAGSAYSFGFASDFRVLVGPTVLSSAAFNWFAVYDALVQEVLDTGTMVGNRALYPGTAAGAVTFAPMSDRVPLEIQTMVQQREAELFDTPRAHAGEEVIFCGAAIEGALDENGDPVVPEGTDGCLSIDQVQRMVWHLPTVAVIDGAFYYNDVYMDSSSAGYIAMMTVVSIATAFSVLCAIGIIVYHKTPVVHYSSVFFAAVIFVGGFLQYVAAFLYLQRPSDAVCMLAVWFELIGAIVMIAAIVVKNARIWWVFRATKKMTIVKVTNVHLFVCLVAAVGPLLVLLILWTTLDLWGATTVLNPQDLDVDERYLKCASDDENVWFGVSFGYIGVWLLAAAIFSWLTRRFPSVFNESTVIALAVYNIILLEIITLPLVLTMSDQEYAARTILFSLAAMYRALATLSLIMVPKLFVALVTPEKNVKPRIATSRTSRGNTSSKSNNDGYRDAGDARTELDEVVTQIFESSEA